LTVGEIGMHFLLQLHKYVGCW